MSGEIYWITIDKAERVFHVTTSTLQTLIDSGEIRHLQKGGSDGFYTYVDKDQVAGRFPKRSVKEKYVEQTPAAALGGFFGALMAEVSEIKKSLSDTASEAAEALSDEGTVNHSDSSQTHGDAGEGKTCSVEGLRAFRQSMGFTAYQLSARIGLPRNTYTRAERGESVSYGTAQAIVSGAKKIRKDTGKSGSVPKIIHDI